MACYTLLSTILDPLTPGLRPPAPALLESGFARVECRTLNVRFLLRRPIKLLLEYPLGLVASCEGR